MQQHLSCFSGDNIYTMCEIGAERVGMIRLVILHPQSVAIENGLQIQQIFTTVNICDTFNFYSVTFQCMQPLPMPGH